LIASILSPGLYRLSVRVRTQLVAREDTETHSNRQAV